ncbi:spore coat U domain-containing protein [Sphingomonas sp. MMS24-J13]|uniref:Csu type fimbrial protein n=1 Tax=Sphingomonas sp. MMS24-J13 TaxID=3238686 RepID=UPI00384E0278
MALFLCAAGLFAPAATPAACTVSTAGITFGIYNPTSPTPADSAGAISVECTYPDGDAGYVIALGAGSSGDSQRTMIGGNGVLHYQLFLDAGHSQSWGDGNGGSSVISGAGSRRQTYPIYGRIPARQAVVPGSFFDMPVMTITF